MLKKQVVILKNSVLEHNKNKYIVLCNLKNSIYLCCRK